MPIEYEILKDREEPFRICPSCCYEPFEAFMRGQVHRNHLVAFILARFRMEKSFYCSVICSECKEIVGYENMVGEVKIRRKFQ